MSGIKWIASTLATLAACLALTSIASAAVPTTIGIEGVVTSAGGGAAADGAYGVAFALYPQASGGTAVWSETGGQITVKSGSFTYALGAKAPLSAATLAAASDLYLGMSVGSDPELPRVPLRSDAYALVADTALKANGLECSGCIKAGALDSAILQPYAKTSDLSTYAKAADLTGLAKTADLAAYAKSSDLAAYAKSADLSAYAKSSDLSAYVKAASLATVAGTGKYSDLTGLPVLAAVGSACGSGLVVKGLKADGSMDCINPFDAAGPDTLSKLSMGLLSNKYAEVVPSAAAFDIKDNDPTGSSNGIIAVPDLGNAIDLTVSIELTTKDASGLILRLYDPNNTEYVLYNKTSTGTTLKLTLPTPDKLASGDLTTWVGKNPKGNWQLAVADTKANGGGIDGQVSKWSINVGIWSDKKVALGGNLVFTANSQACNAWQKGAVRWNDLVAGLQICDGSNWFPRLLGTTQTDPGLTCLDIKTQAPNAKSGTYWIDPDGSASTIAPFQVYCDQETGDGGWTLVAKVKGKDATMNRLNTAQWRTKTPIANQDCTTTKDENALCSAYDKVPFQDVMIRSLAKPNRNLAWRHRDTYASAWAVVNAGARVMTQNKLFGSVNTLDYNGDQFYFRDCGDLAYGWFTADWSQNYNGIAGHALVHGHSGGVVGASLFDPGAWANGKTYGPSSYSTVHCVTDFSLGSCYDNCNNGGNDTYSINAHWWGNGNEYTWDWNSHGLFVR